MVSQVVQGMRFKTDNYRRNSCGCVEIGIGRNLIGDTTEFTGFLCGLC